MSRSRPMDNPRPLRVVPTRGAAGEGLGERAGAVTPGRVDDQPGRLVDHEEMVVLIGDPERDGRFGGSGGDRLARFDADPLAGGDLVALGPGVAVDAHPSGVDRRLRLRPRAERPGQEAVQPRPGRRLVDRQLKRRIGHFLGAGSPDPPLHRAEPALRT